MELKATNPTRLGLALNFAVFLYELLQDIPAAISIAKEAFEHGVNDLELVEVF
jgi:14-3-3 protein epsilon